MLNSVTYAAGTWLLEEPISCGSLAIESGAELSAPEGRYLLMTIDGVVKSILPGEYHGDVKISVNSYAVQEVYPSVNRKKPINMETVLYIGDGLVYPEKCAENAILSGKVTGRNADDLFILADKPNLAGIIVDGDCEYTINRAKIEFDGQSDNDFVGIGAGVVALGNAKVTINDSDFNLGAVTRCAVHVGGKSTVTVNNSRMRNQSEDCDLAAWSWGISVRGSNRLNQLADDGVVYYNNCDMSSNGWGVLSVDGSNYASMFVKDSVLKLSGPRSHGYGAFCIGPTHVHMDHTKVDVNGFPIMIMGMEDKATVDLISGCEIKGRRFGIHLIGDSGSVVTIQDSFFNTGKSCIVAKGSYTTINIDNSALRAGNNVLLQMMDSDDPGMSADFIDVSMYRKMTDTRIEGRDLAKIDPKVDMVINISNSTLEGNLFNSSTDLKKFASKKVPDGVPKRPGLKAPGALAGSIPGAETDGMPAPAGPPPGEMPPFMDGMAKMMAAKEAPKNLSVNLRNTRLTGDISAATQQYGEGIEYIEETTREELCNVAQTAAPPVNNGVVASLCEGSVWTVTGSSWLTALTIEQGCSIQAPAGKIVTMTVDGVETPIKAGSWKGIIALTVK